MSVRSWINHLSPDKKSKSSNPSDDLKESIVQLDCAAKAAIQDIWKCDGSLEDLQQEYEAASKKLKELRTSIEKFELTGLEADDIKVKADIESSAKHFREQMQNTNLLRRKAFLEKKASLDEKSKNLLVNGIQDRELRKRRTAAANRENLARTANDITQNLLSISRVMSNSVKQSEDSLNTLVRSSGTVQKTNEELKDQSGVIQTGHRLLTKYSRRECTDKFLMFLALAFFFSTVLYILKKRLWPA